MRKEEIELEQMEILKNNTLEKINENLYLTNYQKQVLENYHIPFQNCKNAKELLFYLSDITDEEEYDELEEVARQIDEFSYYHETHK